MESMPVELREAIEGQMYAGPSEADLGDLLEVLREVIEDGTPAQRKALLRRLVAEIRVESREAIHPTFRPAGGATRLVSTMVGGAGFEPATSCV